MRSTQHSYTLVRVLSFSLILSLLAILFVPHVPAQDDELQIEILNLEENNTGDNVMYEGNSYTVGVRVDEGLAVLQDVTISVPWATFLTTNATPILEFTAPSYDDYSSFVMTASKAGYVSANITITVLHGALYITTPSTSVREGNKVTVEVTDQHGGSIPDAQILLRGVPIAQTDSLGQVQVTAPDVDQDMEVVIGATKDGYVSSTRTIVVSNVHSQLFTVDMSQILPVIVAGFAVIFAVGYVRWRQTHREPKQQPKEDAPWSPGVRVRNRSTPEDFSTPSHGPSKVEEIRIPVLERRRDTTVISSTKDRAHHAPEKHLEYDQWFQGTDYAKFKLDEMTGHVDKRKEGKWFEGEDDIESKVDLALKRKASPRKPNRHDDE